MMRASASRTVPEKGIITKPNLPVRVIAASSFDCDIDKYNAAHFCEKPKDILEFAEVKGVKPWAEFSNPDPWMLQEALDKPSINRRSRLVVLFSKTREVRRRRYPNRHYKKMGQFLIDASWAVDSDPMLAIMPFDDLRCPTAPPHRLAFAIDIEVEMAIRDLQNFDACLKPEMLAKLKKARKLVKLDINYAKDPLSNVHRRRAIQGRHNVEIRILPQDWCEPIQLALIKGILSE